MKHLQSALLFLCLLFFNTALISQSEIELRTDGIVVPRTTPAAVTSPVRGMLIYDTDVDAFKYYDGRAWQSIGDGSGEGTVSWSDVTGKPSGFADGTDDVKDADANASNELQDISLSMGAISLSNSSSSIPLSDISPWTIDGFGAVKDKGRVGIGELSPIARLDINSLSGEDGLRVRIKGDEALKVHANSKVGIGEPNPNARVDIKSNAGEDGLRVRIDGSTKFRVRENGGVNIGGNPNTVPANGLRVYGNTSLGTTQSPTERLEVVGAINLSGSASSNNPDAGTIRWNSSTIDFEGYDGANWKSLTGLPSPPPPPPSYQVGDFEDEGVVFYVSPDEKTIKFVYLGRFIGSIWSLPIDVPVNGADSNFDGIQNTIDIISQTNITNSIAEFCANLSAGGHNDWYLPAINELQALYDQRAVVDSSISDNLGDMLGTHAYWSSTENRRFDEAYFMSFSSGIMSSISKGSTLDFRAVRTIVLP